MQNNRKYVGRSEVDMMTFHPKVSYVLATKPNSIEQYRTNFSYIYMQ